MARRRKGRPVHGILLLDKASGLSSNQALQRVKRLYGAAKAGHTGSLDPLATGMLPICLGEATKLSAQLLDADKCYQVRMLLGQATDTADADGTVIRTLDATHVDRAAMEAVLPRFVGVIEQVPPMYSALKHEGRRLYELARQGLEVERPARRVTIHALRLIRFESASAELEVRCSKGTYIRSLVEDLAHALETCAHVAALRRTEVGPFDQVMIDEGRLQRIAEEGGTEALDRLLLPPDAALRSWPAVRFDADASFYFRRGQAIQWRGAPLSGRLAVYDGDGLLLGLAEIDQDGRVAPRRLLELRQKEN